MIVPLSIRIVARCTHIENGLEPRQSLEGSGDVEVSVRVLEAAVPDVDVAYLTAARMVHQSSK